MIALLWPIKGPPILLIAGGLQYSQASTKLIQSSVLGVRLDDFAGTGPWIEDAVWLALGAVLSLALGMRLGSRGGGFFFGRNTHGQITIGPESALRFYVATYIAALVFTSLAKLGDGAGAQLFIHLSGIRWVGLFVLFYSSLQPEGRRSYAVAVLLLDIVMGFSGFFSSFKETFYVAIAAIIASGARMNFKRASMLAVLSIVLLTLASFWTVIKMDYRQFLNRGTGYQVVLQTFEDRISYISRRVSTVDVELLRSGFGHMLDRVSYVYYLGRTMDNIPRVIPHKEGALLGGALMHILTPRLFFPDKPPLVSDTIVTATYANMGNYFARQADRTSISIGYVGELYIDFGIWGTILACVCLGFLYGRMHRSLCNYSSLPMSVNYGLSIMVLLNAVQFERALVKTVGAIVASYLVALLLRRFVFPWLFELVSSRRNTPQILLSHGRAVEERRGSGLNRD